MNRVHLLLVDFDAIYAVIRFTLTVRQLVFEYMIIVVLNHDGLVHHLFHVCKSFLLVDAPRVLALVHVLSVAELRLRLLILSVKRNRLVHLRVRLLFRHRHFHDVFNEITLLERAVEIVLFGLFALVLRCRLELDLLAHVCRRRVLKNTVVLFVWLSAEYVLFAALRMTCTDVKQNLRLSLTSFFLVSLLMLSLLCLSSLLLRFEILGGRFVTYGESLMLISLMSLCFLT